MNTHLETTVGVYAFVIKGKKLLLLHKPNDPIWTALGGRMDSGDKSPILALEREVREELGSEVEINIDDILDVKLWSANYKDYRLGVFYVCSLENEDVEFKLSHEHDDYKFFSFDEAIDMWKTEDRGATGIELGIKLKEKGYLE